METESTAENEGPLPDAIERSKEQPTMGTSLGKIRRGMTRLADRLQSVLTRDDADQLEAILTDLNGQRCRVAVLGQVKAGKSSLVNVLIRRPSLSPTDINPWTAVVCHLNFGVPADPMARAVFTFFNDEDWNYLSSGGRLQELSNRLGVAVDQELLREQLTQTRLRAEQRLGRQFNHLLGQQHRFAQPSAELLARYVSVGHGMDMNTSRRHPAAGRYSDVTKSAELFFDQAPFAYPTTIIDTPGTNDPFLVRDDLTGQAVDGADAHIVVLTAEQAFSTADLAMLRMLHGLHKERMIVFVNRIDVLDDVAADSRKVVDYVRSKLADEFPNTDIPVVAGSALWAERALGEERSRPGDDLPPTLRDYARGQPALDALTHGGSDLDPAAREAAIMAAAGITELEATIDRLLQRGPSMLSLRRSLGKLEAAYGSVQNRLQHDQVVLNNAIGLAKKEEVGVAQRTAEIDRQRNQMAHVPQELESVVIALEQDLNMAKDAAVEGLSSTLHDIILRFAKTEGDALRSADLISRVARTWHCDTSPLRQKLETVFLENFRSAATVLLDIEQTAFANLESSINQLLAEQKIKMKYGQSLVVDPAPSIGALGRTVALDLRGQWSRWWRRWPNTDARVKRLQELVIAEFDPIIEMLMLTAVDELNRQTNAGIARLASIRKDLLGLLDKQQQRLNGLRRKLAGDGGGAPVAMLIERYRTRLEKCSRDLDHCREIEPALRTLVDETMALAAVTTGEKIEVVDRTRKVG